MKSFDIDNPKFRLALIYPVQSIVENPVRGWLAGIGLAAWQWAVDSRIMWLAIITATVLGFIDQRVGEKRARATNTHNSLKADHGIYGKQIGIVLVLALIPFEVIISSLLGYELNGALPTAAATWIAWHEYESLHEKYTDAGKPGIPVVSHIAGLLRRITAAIGEKKDV